MLAYVLKQSETQPNEPQSHSHAGENKKFSSRLVMSMCSHMSLGKGAIENAPACECLRGSFGCVSLCSLLSSACQYLYFCTSKASKLSTCSLLRSCCSLRSSASIDSLVSPGAGSLKSVPCFACVSLRQHTPAYVSIRQRMRQHSSAYVRRWRVGRGDIYSIKSVPCCIPACA